jgi:hypothetical protein
MRACVRACALRACVWVCMCACVWLYALCVHVCGSAANLGDIGEFQRAHILCSYGQILSKEKKRTQYIIQRYDA